MYRLFLVATVLTFGAAPAFAADDVMAHFYGNTVVSSGGMIESHTHYRADHTFDLTASAMGQTFNAKGTWKIDDKGQLCRMYETAPPRMPNPLCIPAEPHKPGDIWRTIPGTTSSPNGTCTSA